MAGPASRCWRCNSRSPLRREQSGWAPIRWRVAFSFVSAEDDVAELHRRLANIARVQGVRIADLDKLEILPLAGKDAILAAPMKRDGPLFPDAALRRHPRRDRNAAAELLILDTLADLFGGDEIKRPHARQFIGLLRGLALEFRITIVLLSHPSQFGMTTGTGTSGSTAWSNSVRSRLYLEMSSETGGKREADDARVLTTKKANYGRAGGGRALRWREGVFVFADAAGADKMEADDKDDRTFLMTLAEFARTGREVSACRRPALLHRRSSPRSPKAGGLSKARLKAAMERLFHCQPHPHGVGRGAVAASRADRRGAAPGHEN